MGMGHIETELSWNEINDYQSIGQLQKQQELVSRCFEPGQPQRITSGLEKQQEEIRERHEDKCDEIEILTEDTINELPHFCDPVSSKLDQILIENKICEEAHRGNRSLGINVTNIWNQKRTFVTTSFQQPQNMSATTEILWRRQKFKQLNSLYSLVHSFPTACQLVM